MIKRAIVLGAVLALLAGGAGTARAQRSDYERKAAEWNAFQDIQRAQTPAERLQFIDAFLKNYPQSSYRAFVYPAYAETALASKQYSRAMEAVDGLQAMDRSAVLAAYREGNPNLEDAALEPLYYRTTVVYTVAFLQGFKENTPQSDAIAAKAAERARNGLEMHAQLYAAAQPPQGVTPEQFNQIKKQEEAAFHGVLAYVGWRSKDYASSAKEYAYLVKLDPENLTYNYRLAISNLKQDPPQWLPGMWSLARTVNLTTGDKKSVRDTLAQNVTVYEGLYDASCADDEVAKLLESSKQSPLPPADWRLASREELQGIRESLSVAKLMEGLKAGGETAHKTWLASCHAPFPEIQGIVLAVDSDPTGNSMQLKIAITNDAVDARTPQIVLHITDQPEAKAVRADDEIGFTGVMISYQADPFLLTLTQGKINPETLPKSRRRGGASAR